MTKFGVRCVPNSRLKMSTQAPPQDGVAAAAESIPTVLTPPTRVTVAAAAKTLLLKPMESSLLGTTAVPCARLLLLASWWATLGPATTALVRAGTADLTGSAVL